MNIFEHLVDETVEDPEEESLGTRIARENRAVCNNLTNEERTKLREEALQYSLTAKKEFSATTMNLLKVKDDIIRELKMMSPVELTEIYYNIRPYEDIKHIHHT